MQLVLVNLTSADEEVLSNFVSEFFKVKDAIKESGALSEDTSPYLVGKYALVLAAQKFAPTSPEYKKELENLKHFV